MTPFVFHFSVDARGFPLAMTLYDLKIECGECHSHTIQRFFYTLPLHPMTLDRLLEESRTLPSKCNANCCSCNAPLSDKNVCTTILTWGLSGESGVFRIIHELPEVEQCVGMRHSVFDPQTIPSFSIDPHEYLFEELTEQSFHAYFNRFFSIKKAIIYTIVRAWEERCTIMEDLTPEMQVTVWRKEEEAPYDPDEDWIVTDLLDCEKLALPTLPYGHEVAGRAETWLGESIWEKIKTKRLNVCVYIERRIFIETLSKLFSEALIRYEINEEGFTHITSPSGETLSLSNPPSSSAPPSRVTFLDLARRALYTGVSPEISARLTGEEVIAHFLQLNRVVTGPGEVKEPTSGCC